MGVNLSYCLFTQYDQVLSKAIVTVVLMTAITASSSLIGNYQVRYTPHMCCIHKLSHKLLQISVAFSILLL